MITIISSRMSMTRSEVEGRVNAVIERLSGFLSSDSIALYSEPCLDGIILLLASMKLGLKIVLCPLREPISVVDNWLIKLGINQLIFCGKNIDIRCMSINCISFDKLMAMPRNKIVNNNCNYSTVMRTSGSTGTPKSALINNVSHEASARAVNQYFDFNESSCWLLSLPLYHVSGFSIIVRALLGQGSIYLLETGELLYQGLRSSRISHCSLVPAQLKKLIKEEADLSHLQAIIIGGDALSSLDREEAVRRGWHLYESYGLTETASMVWVHDVGKQAHFLPHAEVRLACDGELLVSGQSLFSGYVKEHDLDPMLDNAGFFMTGDFGRIEGNQLHIIGRKNNRIISGGENIQAEEIERVLEQHPLIDCCVALGMSDDHYGQRPIAFIKWRQKNLDHEELTAWLAGRLSPYKWPDAFLDWPSHIAHEGKKPRHVLSQHAFSLLSNSA